MSVGTQIHFYRCHVCWSVGHPQTFARPRACASVYFFEATVLGSRAPSTICKYSYAFQKWKTWAEAHSEIEVFPVQGIDFALYLQYLGDTTGSKSAVEEAVNSISWVNQLAGFPAVSESSFVRIALDGLQHKLAKPKMRKEPVTTDMLSALVRSLSANPSLSEIRCAFSCCMSPSILTL